MTTGKVNIAVLGAAGSIGQRHVQHIVLEPEARLFCLVDPAPEANELAAHAGVPCFATVEGLLEYDVGIDDKSRRLHAAIVATPTGMHVSQALALITRGIHVLVEKPLCNDLQEAQKLDDAARVAGAGSVLVGFHRRFNPYVANFKAVLDGHNGDVSIGPVLAVNALWCARKPMTYFLQAPWRTSRATGGGVILTNLSHELDLMRFLFGEVSRVYAEAGQKTRGFDVEETVAITLKFVSGCVATILLSDAALTPYFFESATGENPHLSVHHQPVYTVMGTRGTLTFPNAEVWSYKEGMDTEGDWTKTLTRSTTAGLPFDPRAYATDKGPYAPFTKRLQHWIDYIQGRTPALSCTLHDGMRNMVILEAVVDSARRNVPIDV